MRRVFYGYKRPVTQLVLLMHDLELIYDPSVIRVSLYKCPAGTQKFLSVSVMHKEIA